MSARVATPAPQVRDGPPRADGFATASAEAEGSAAGTRLASIALRLWPFALIAAVAFLSRARFIWGYHDTYGSGDASLVMTKAFFIEHGSFSPPGSLGAASVIFGTPPFIPLLFAGVAKGTPLALQDVPLVLGPLVTIAALFALYGVLCRGFDRTIALMACVAVALLPRFAFDSTEPDKVAYVVSFFVIALFLLYEGQRRPWVFLLAGLFMGLSLFSHTTALLFVPVFLGSHIALSRGSVRRTLQPYFIGACAIAIAFFAGYVALDRANGPSAPPFAAAQTAAAPVAGVPQPDAPAPVSNDLPVDALSPAEGSGSIVPASVRQYWNNVRSLGEDGFRDSAWDQYFDGIRNQVLDPVFLLAIGGFGVGAWLAIARRQLEIVPLLLWMSVVTLGLAIQHPAPSHGTRYPSYVTPVFVVMAVFFVIWGARQVAQRLSWEPAYALGIAAPVLAWVAFSYATAPEQGLRRLYGGHEQLAAYVNEQQLLSDDGRLLYLGWPSYTFELLEGGANEDQLQTFGWQQIDFERQDFEAQRIRYYAYDDYNEDYFTNAGKMGATIALQHNVREVTSFCINPAFEDGQQICTGRVHLFELLSKRADVTP